MVRSKESKDIFLRPLIRFIDFDAVFHEFDGVDHECYAIEELPFTSFFQNILIKCSLVRFRDDIPSFDRPFMAVVE